MAKKKKKIKKRGKTNPQGTVGYSAEREAVTPGLAEMLTSRRQYITPESAGVTDPDLLGQPVNLLPTVEVGGWSDTDDKLFTMLRNQAHHNPAKSGQAKYWTGAEFMPGVGDIAEAGYVGDDLRKGNYGSALAGALLGAVPGNWGGIKRGAKQMYSKGGRVVRRPNWPDNFQPGNTKLDINLSKEAREELDISARSTGAYDLDNAYEVALEGNDIISETSRSVKVDIFSEEGTRRAKNLVRESNPHLSEKEVERGAEEMQERLSSAMQNNINKEISLDMEQVSHRLAKGEITEQEAKEILKDGMGLDKDTDGMYRWGFGQESLGLGGNVVNDTRYGSATEAWDAVESAIDHELQHSGQDVLRHPANEKMKRVAAALEKSGDTVGAQKYHDAADYTADLVPTTGEYPVPGDGVIADIWKRSNTPNRAKHHIETQYNFGAADGMISPEGTAHAAGLRREMINDPALKEVVERYSKIRPQDLQDHLDSPYNMSSAGTPVRGSQKKWLKGIDPKYHPILANEMNKLLAPALLLGGVGTSRIVRGGKSDGS